MIFTCIYNIITFAVKLITHTRMHARTHTHTHTHTHARAHTRTCDKLIFDDLCYNCSYVCKNIDNKRNQSNIQAMEKEENI